jgi:hypothetical protein
LLASDTPDAKVRVFESLGLRVTFLHTFSPNRPPNEKGGFRIICEDDTGHRWDMQVWMLHAANQYKSTMVDLNGQVVEDASSPMPFTADGSGGDKPNIKPPLWEKAVSALPDGAPHRDIMAWWVLSYGVVLEFTINKDSELFDSDVVNLIVAAA